MSEKRYTSGEIAAAAGLTIHTVRHYDHIGLLPSRHTRRNGPDGSHRLVAASHDRPYPWNV